MSAAVEAIDHSKNALYREDCQCCGFSTHTADTDSPTCSYIKYCIVMQ